MVAYSFKERFIRPIRAGLSRVSLSFDPPPKRQTIRAHGKRRHARPGEELQLYYAMRTKHCKLIGVARCTEIQSVKLFIGPASIGVDIDGRYFCGDTVTKEFAQADGFDDVQDMLQFWNAEHPSVREFSGALIKWEPLA